MSRFSGKCDLYDSIFMVENKENEVDEKIFEKFKKETNGKIYKLFNVELDNYNIDKFCNLDTNSQIKPLFPIKKVEHSQVIKDKRYKNGERIKKWYTYMYLDNEFKSPKEINKIGFNVQKTINIETLLDLVEYFPYIICIETYSNNNRYILISNKSYVDYMEINQIEQGYDSKFIDIYREALKNYYKDEIKKELK